MNFSELKKYRTTYYLLLIVFAFICLFVRFKSNVHVDFSSERYVWERAAEIKESGIFSNCLLIKDFYFSQIALHGTLYGIIINLFGLEFCYTFVAAISAFVFLLLLIWIYSEFGLFVSFFAFIAVLASDILHMFANSPNQSLFLFILPAIISLFFLRYEEKKGTDLTENEFKIWNIAIFSVILLKSLFLFEAITIPLMNAVIPIVYYAMKNNGDKKKFFKYFIFISMSGVFAFLISILLHIIQLFCYFEGNYEGAIITINNDIARRMGLTERIDDYLGHNEGISQEALSASKSYVLGLYLNMRDIIVKYSDITFYKILKVYFGFVIAGFISLFFIKSKEEKRKLIAFTLFSFLSVIASLSWYVIGSPHSFEHTHILGFYMSLPGIIFVFAYMSYIPVIYFEIIKEKFVK